MEKQQRQHLFLKCLKEGNKSPLIAGNIGTVASEVSQNAKEDNQIVIELSSFQLMGIQRLDRKLPY